MSLTVGQKTRLGIFMVAGVVIMSTLIIIPIIDRLTNIKKTYFTVFTGESLSGLENGADVKYRGIPIGKVRHILYDPKHLATVRVELSVDSDFPMKKDMVAVAGMLGITGLKYVEITGGTDSSAVLPENGVLDSKQSLMASITGKTEAIMGKIELFINHLNEITNPDSLASVKRIIRNVDEISGTVNTFAKDMAPQARDLSASLRRTTMRLDSITADMRSITLVVKDSLDAHKIISIINHVDTMSTSLKNLSESLDQTVHQSKEDISVSLENLRQTLENANELSKMLMENPSLIIKGDNPRDRNDR